MTDFEGPRIDYGYGELSEQVAGDDPAVLFRRWLDDATAFGVNEPTAMTLATVGADGRPHARIVLMRAFGPEGIRFFTNLRSAKAADISGEQRVAIVFDWIELHRQVRVEGRAEEVAEAVADDYHRGRDRGRQIGAWASPQSQVIASRGELDRRVEAMEARFADDEVPRPPHWGGFVVAPERYEFWQGRPSRLHDRLVFTRNGDHWGRERLAP